MPCQAPVSIIIPVKNSGVDLFMTMESLKVSHTCLPYEVIIVNEDSIDGCCDFLMNYRFHQPVKLLKGHKGLPSRNLAAAHASGEYLIFCSPRLYFEDDWMELLLMPLMVGEADCVSPQLTIHESSRRKPPCSYEGLFLHSVQSFPWIGQGDELSWLSWECFAVSRAKFQEIGGMEEGFLSKELEAAEFSLRIWLLGGSCRLVSGVLLKVVFRQNFPNDDSSNQWGEDLLSISHLHFSDIRIASCRELVSQVFGLDILHNENAILDRVALSKEKYAVRRIRDDSWFFQHFGIPV
ncbi:glycosyl transferase family 2 [Fontibacillus phaseoli]|uniref:Glycosyl transferase family 2 n=1 Tax=Fontibacillus phaseoli TaxID=1416533 RepID=A0A369B6Y7_9BACL|nr:glycosyltransferase [Fontibacillus phaseoli]RCX17279.1 glycosyl transferase family 2 [Fontibacillus phaseoli]